ncbi:hypothetical protein DL98DRAFT_173151 [Cadophora sp. DSE1049]|nr:hypothetical protein DL98DRAFT_173151 [Cadophora sp. DSE1049]
MYAVNRMRNVTTMIDRLTPLTSTPINRSLLIFTPQSMICLTMGRSIIGFYLSIGLCEAGLAFHVLYVNTSLPH